MRAWFSGKTSAFQAEDAGSIPAARFQNKLFFDPNTSSEMISKELLLFIETDFSLMVKGSKILDMLVSRTFNQLYLHFGKGKSILFEYAFKPIQTSGLVLPLLMLKAIV